MLGKLSPQKARRALEQTAPGSGRVTIPGCVQMCGQSTQGRSLVVDLTVWG